MNQDLQNHIKQMHKKGFSDKKIRRKLLKSGWTEDTIEEEIKIYNKNKGFKSHNSLRKFGVFFVKFILYVALSFGILQVVGPLVAPYLIGDLGPYNFFALVYGDKFIIILFIYIFIITSSYHFIYSPLKKINEANQNRTKIIFGLILVAIIISGLVLSRNLVKEKKIYTQTLKEGFYENYEKWQKEKEALYQKNNEQIQSEVEFPVYDATFIPKEYTKVGAQFNYHKTETDKRPYFHVAYNNLQDYGNFFIIRSFLPIEFDPEGSGCGYYLPQFTNGEREYFDYCKPVGTTDVGNKIYKSNGFDAVSYYVFKKPTLVVLYDWRDENITNKAAIQILNSIEEINFDNFEFFNRFNQSQFKYPSPERPHPNL